MSYRESLLIFGLIIVLGLAMHAKLVTGDSHTSACTFPAIYNFGDSNSDTGTNSAAFAEVPAPYGVTFFKKPSKRLSDGRLIIDIIAEKLRIPYLSAYLDSIGTSYRHGANFAAADSSILPGSSSPFDLAVQISQFSQFKSRTAELSHNSTTWVPSHGRMPNPDDFTKALYTFDIGQNDLMLAFYNKTLQKVILSMLPRILDRFTHSVQQLYGAGARAFWIHNTGPIGCLPLLVFQHQFHAGAVDSHGCVGFMNDVAQEFNQQLKTRVTQLRSQLPQAKITYIDIFSAKLELIHNAKSYGFGNPLGQCCGTFLPIYVFCGTSLDVNVTTSHGPKKTTIHGSGCKDPSTWISWDGIHYTEAANMWVASRILDGSFSDPPVPIYNACPWTE